jgi:hypothetical protein
MTLHRGINVEIQMNQGKEDASKISAGLSRSASTKHELAAEGSFQAGQTAKALSGYRVQSLPEGHGRQHCDALKI